MSNESLGTSGEMLKSKAKEFDPFKEDVALFKHLINERKNQLDLVRELLSNAGAKEVGATEIEITYSIDKMGHIFEIRDNGCGMDFTNNKSILGRLDKFLGLGLSGVVGRESDEFSWKGLGAKLCFQSKKVEIETKFKNHPLYNVMINEPWSTINRNLIPKPRLSEFDKNDGSVGTRIKVYGHPPHRQEKPFTFEEIRTFLMHRTFAGFTRSREKPPAISLSVLRNTENLKFGFPAFRNVDFSERLHLDHDKKTLFVFLRSKSSKSLQVILKGFLTWEGKRYNLSNDNLNTGLILSAKGIPYFNLDLEEFGARSINRANPGINGICLVVECDAVNSEMNISRSDLIDSELSLKFKETLIGLIQTLESSTEYLTFRKIPKDVKKIVSADHLANIKAEIESEDQNWVVIELPGQKAEVLVREPKNEQEVNLLLWKLEAKCALPFARFQTLAYPGVSKGPDLIVNFQEDQYSEMVRAAAFEVERNFYNYKSHGHISSQYPRVICWEAPSKGRKLRLNETAKKYKYVANMDNFQLHVYVIQNFDGIRVMSRKKIKSEGVAL